MEEPGIVLLLDIAWFHKSITVPLFSTIQVFSMNHTDNISIILLAQVHLVKWDFSLYIYIADGSYCVFFSSNSCILKVHLGCIH